MRIELSSARHLTLQSLKIRPGEEWRPQTTGWLVIRVDSGFGYWLDSQNTLELLAGALLVVAGKVGGCIRASLLGELQVQWFRVEPDLLTGLATLGEQSVFKSAEGNSTLARRNFAPNHVWSLKFAELVARCDRHDLSCRVRLLEFFAGLFGRQLEQCLVTPQHIPVQARERLENFLKQTPPSEFLNVSFAELAQRISCTPRHLGRIFREVSGVSFREQQARIRLGKARELLAFTETKVVDIAEKSGYQSLSLFSLMFKKRFGLSPGQWRRKHRSTTNGQSSEGCALAS